MCNDKRAQDTYRQIMYEDRTKTWTETETGHDMQSLIEYLFDNIYWDAGG